MKNCVIKRQRLRSSFGVFVLFALLVGGVCRPAWAIESNVQRRDYAFNTYFEVADGNVPTGTIIRQRWRQPLRSSYELYDAAGDALASATTRLLSMGIVFPWARTLDITDSQTGAGHTLRGVWFTMETAIFELSDEAGVRLADLRMDLKHSGFVATYPNKPRSLIGRFYRNQISDHNHERWDYNTFDNRVVPAYVWPLLAAFFADIW